MRLLAMLRLRCPRCFRGEVFRSFWRMHETCPNCDFQYARGEGYFFGAMYFSYGLGVVLTVPVAIIMFLNDFHVDWIGVVLLAQLAVLSPIIFRYSRVVWMHFDHLVDPPQDDEEGTDPRRADASDTRQPATEKRRA